MNAPRKRPREERLKAPLQQPEVRQAMREADPVLLQEVLFPPDLWKHLDEVERLSREVLALVHALRPVFSFYARDLEAVAALSGINIEEEVDPVAPMPEDPWSREGAHALRQRAELLHFLLQTEHVHRLAVEGVPRWTEQADDWQGFFVLLHRLVEAVGVLKAMHKPLTVLRQHAADRLKAIRFTTQRTEVPQSSPDRPKSKRVLRQWSTDTIPAGPKGGRPGDMSRAFALELAARLRSPEVSREERWTPIELLALFRALNIESLDTIEAVKELLRRTVRRSRAWTVPFPVHVPKMGGKPSPENR